MRVLQVGKFFPPDPGGVETATRQAAEALTRCGIENQVLCFAGPCSADADAAVCPVHREPVLATLASQPLSASYVRRFLTLAPGFDIIHLHAPNPLAALALWLARPRGKVVVHWHSDVIGHAALLWLYRPLERWLARRADLVIGPTSVHIEQSDLAREFAGKGAVVPFCVDACMASPDKADPAAVAALRQRLGGRRVVFALGRLVAYKGFGVLIEAAREMPEDAVVVIGGGGPLAAALAARVEALGLSGRVVLAGRIPDADLASWFAVCDVFCLPSVSRAEMFGIVQLEAMAFGKPVVSTAIARSGVPRVNAHGVTGLVAPPGDAPALGRALRRLLDDESLRDRLGQGGLAAVAGPYAPAAVDRALLRAYARVAPEAAALLDILPNPAV